MSSDPWADYQRPFSAEQSVNGTADEPDQVLNGNLSQLKQLKQKFRSCGSASRSAAGPARRTSRRRPHVGLAGRPREVLPGLWLKGNLPGLPAGAAKGIFDGVDLDWEWPASEGNPGNVIRPEDKQNFTALVHEYRKQLDRLSRPGRYNLTAFLPANPTMIDKGFEVQPAVQGPDLRYDAGLRLPRSVGAADEPAVRDRRPQGDPTTPEFSSQVTIDSYLVPGRAAEQTRDGGAVLLPRLDRRHGPERRPVPAFHRSRTGDVRSGYGGLPLLKATLANYTVYRDNKAGFAWLFDGTTFWTWDDPIEMTRKAQYISQRDLGGAMIWSLDGDTGNGELISALHRNLR